MKKYLNLIPEKGLSKNKPTCENAVSQILYGNCTLRVMGSFILIISKIRENTESSKYLPNIWIFVERLITVQIKN